MYPGDVFLGFGITTFMEAASCYYLILIHAVTLECRLCGSSDGKESACKAGNLGLIPGSGRFPKEGNGNPLQCSCLGNPMDRRAWWAIVHRVAKCQTQLH